jgi:hypothetical protein
MKASVNLDAGASYDPEGLPLRCRWYYDSELVSEQDRFTTEFLAGARTFRLEVGDPTGLTASDEATATVTLVVNTKVVVSPQEMLRSSSQDVVAPAVLPRGKSVKDFDAAEPLVDSRKSQS